MIFLKIILAVILWLILFQDIKERQVYWFLFPIIGGLSGYLFYKNTLPELFVTAIFMNLAFVGLLMIFVFLYAHYKLKIRFFNTIGLGDVLLFIGLSLSFPTVSFIIIFIGALIFSLILHLFLSKSKKTVTVPLAGYMSLFFLMTYISYWTGLIDSIYTI